MILEGLVWFFNWLLRRVGGLNLIQLILLYLTLGSTGIGLAAGVEQLQSGLLLIVAFYSLLFGWLLTRTRIPGWGFGLTGTLLGILGLVLTVGRIGRAIASMMSSLIPVLGQVVQHRPLDFSAPFAAWGELSVSLMTLVARFGNWFRGIQTDALVIDPLVTSIVWGMVFWLMALWAIWWVQQRGSTLLGLLPAVVILGYDMFYTNSWNGTIWLVLTGGGILLLQAFNHYRASRQRWVMRRMDQVAIEPMLIFSVVLLTGGMMLAGGILPSVSIHKIIDAIDKIFRLEPDKNLSESLSLEQTPQPGAHSGILAPTGIHSIGPAPNLAQNPVMFVSVEGYIPPVISEFFTDVPQLPVLYYWRAQTYDMYTGYGWIAGTSHVNEMAANQPLLPTEDSTTLAANYKLVIQHVTRLQVGDGAIFAAGELLKLDQPTTILWSDSGDVISARTDSNIYTAVSRIQSVNVEQLRSAGTNYPPSILRYLELPDELPLRVRNLALDLTADQPTPYDQASVLETYLRQFPYSLDVPGPPAKRDAVDYFLFDLKMGYCDYSASAMVVMARAAGLPARLVLGYSPGTYDEVEKRFVVSASNAHAWAEIYFPNIGWVEFEPTPTQPRPIRPGQEQDGSQAAHLPSPGKPFLLRIHLESTQLFRLLGILLVATAVVILVLSLPFETWWLSLFPTERALIAIFHRLYRRGHFFGIPPDPSRTSHEFALALSAGVERFATNGKRAALIAGLRTDLDCLTSLYTRLLFSRQPLGRQDLRKAVRLWTHLRRGLDKIRRWRNML